MDCAFEFIGVDEGLMGELIRLEVAPDWLDIVEFRGILGAASAAGEILLVWIGPLSSTSTTGLVGCPGLGP